MAAVVQVVGGVDPHADTVHVAVLTAVGKVIGDAEFATDAGGYARAVEFLTSYGLVERVGVEGAASYGAGITSALTAAGISVVEVERPTRSARRRAGNPTRSMLTMPRGQCWQSDPLRSRIPRSAGCGPCTWPADRRSRRAPRPATR